MTTFADRIAKLTTEVNKLRSKMAGEPPKKFRLWPKEIFSDYHGLGTESIDRMRAMVEAAKQGSAALTEADKFLFGGAGGLAGSALKATSGVDDFLRSRDAAALTDADRKQLTEYIRKQATARLKQRLKEVEVEAAKYGLR